MIQDRAMKNREKLPRMFFLKAICDFPDMKGVLGRMEGDFKLAQSAWKYRRDLHLTYLLGTNIRKGKACRNIGLHCWAAEEWHKPM